MGTQELIILFYLLVPKISNILKVFFFFTTVLKKNKTHFSFLPCKHRALLEKAGITKAVSRRMKIIFLL